MPQKLREKGANERREKVYQKKIEATLMGKWHCNSRGSREGCRWEGNLPSTATMAISSRVLTIVTEPTLNSAFPTGQGRFQALYRII